MKTTLDPRRTVSPREPEESLHSLLAPLLAAESSALLASHQRLTSRGVASSVPKFLLLGNRSNGVPLRVALFAGLDAGRLETVAATVNLLLRFTLTPKLAQDYALFTYPVVNPGGFSPEREAFESLRETWARNPDDEQIRYYRSEFRSIAFHGLITLRSVPEFQGLQARVRSPLIAAEVVLPALESVRNLVPLEKEPIRVLSNQPDSLRAEFAAGRLMPEPETRPWPFEIELFAPQAASADGRSQALAVVILEILRRYRRFISEGGDL
jgi:hypothetical protein